MDEERESHFAEMGDLLSELSASKVLGGFGVETKANIIAGYSTFLSARVNERMLKTIKTHNKVIWILTGINALVAIFGVLISMGIISVSS
tara:strand:+ start:317 stop:586 length:270 start_codon:yes stop_codon:yes gene_type:complete